jgi:DoxX-like family
MRYATRSESGAKAAALWTVQGLLAALFLFAGGVKLVLPVAAMTQQMPVPGLFLRFIGVCEVLGAIGLVLPGILHVRRALTPLAATGLVLIMFGAVGLTMAAGAIGESLIPLAVAVLAGTVAVGRGREWV